MSISSSWTLASALRSDRLVYRHINNTPEDKDFLFETLMADSTIQAMAGRDMIHPASRKSVDELMNDLEKWCLFSAFICLPPPAVAPEDVTAGQIAGTVTAAGANNGEGNGIGDGDGDGSSKGAKADAAPTPIGFISMSTDMRPLRMHIRDCEVGISLVGPQQNKGYGSEAINWALDWAFRSANMRRVSIVCFGYNERAEYLYKKLGFVEEGRKRARVYHNLKWYDEINLGMLRKEWKELRGVAEGEGDSSKD